MREEFANSVTQFINHANTLDDFLNFQMIQCPCEKCDCMAYETEEVIVDHLYRRGFHSNVVERNNRFNNFVVGESSRSAGHNNVQVTRMMDMVQDAFGMHSDFEFRKNVEESSNEEAHHFYEELCDASRPLCAKTLYKCIERHFKGCWPSWSKVLPEYKILMLNEFLAESSNFNTRARLKLKGLFHNTRRKHKKPKILPPTIRKELLHFCGTNVSSKKRSALGKKARAFTKGDSLHTTAVISRIAVQNKLKKKLGSRITQEELFKVTHVKKRKMPTDDDRWVEPRVQKTHDKYIQRIDKFCSTQPSEIWGTSLTKDKEDQLWKECVGASIRSLVYDRPEENSSLQSRIAKLTSELAASVERRRKMEEENERRFQMLQTQLNNLLQSRTIIHPCSGDARPHEAGLDSLNDYTTEEEEELGDEDEEVEED